MPDINMPVALPPLLQQLAESKLADQKFTPEGWSSDDLQPLRSFIRRHYRTEQRGKCAYCRRTLGKQAAANCHVEHLLAKSRYRSFIFEPRNLCVVCAECNTVKCKKEASSAPIDALEKATAKRYPRSSGAFKIVHPHFDEYAEHIDILKNKFYVPKTPKGYFTVSACDLNAHLREFGWRPEFVDEVEARAVARQFLEAKTPEETKLAIRDLQDALLEF